MEWFRWYHGASTDPKFRIIAKRAGCRTADVVAVWAFILESASCNAMQRGQHSELDFDEIDLVFDFDEGTAENVYSLLVARGLVESDGSVANWSKRQPKREDATSTERSRKHRATQRDAAQRSGTQRDAHKNRTEQSRTEESNPPTPLSSERPAGAGGDFPPVASPPEPEPDHPAWSPPPLVFTRGKERDPRADDAWTNRVQALWRERKGGRLPRDQVIGLLAEHIDELGADEVVARLDRYCEAVSGQFATIRNFANGITDWSEQRRKRLDDDGSLTLDEALRRSREESRQRRAKREAEQKASAA